MKWIRWVSSVPLLFVSMLACAKIDFVEFKEAKIKDAAKILSTMTGANIAVTKEASEETVSLLLQNTELNHAVDIVARVAGLWYRYNRSANSYIIMTEQQYQDDIVVYREDIIKTFTLKHQNVSTTAVTIQSLFGDRVRLTLQNENDDFIGLDLEIGDDNEATTIDDEDDNDRDSDVEIQELERQDLSDAQQTSLSANQLSTGTLRQLGQAEAVDAGAANRLVGLSTPIFIATNKIHNLLHVRTSDQNAMAEIERLIEDSDKPTPQVLLEMKIVRIDVGENYERDFDLSFDDSLNLSGNFTTSIDTFDPQAITFSAAETSVNQAARTFSQLSGSNGTAFGFAGASGGFYDFFSNYVNATIEVLEQNNQAEIVAKPIIMASNNRPARLFIGSEQIVPVNLQTDTTFSNANDNGDRNSVTTSTLETERRQIGDTLILLPSVNADRTVTIDIFQDSSLIQDNGLNFPFFNNDSNTLETIPLDAVQRSTVRTVVVAKDGRTIALGGLINKEKSNAESVVPLLGDIPLLGEFFRTKEERDESSQFVMLITPHVLLSPDEGVETSQKIAEVDAQLPAHEAAKKHYAVSDYVSLVRFAAKVGKKENPQRPIGLSDAPVGRSPLSFMFTNPDISVWPVGSWERSGLYVTLLKARNTSDKTQVLDYVSVPGQWLAAAIDQKHLTPFGKDGDQSHMFFLSNQPFDEVVSKVNRRAQ